ncbi:MAG: T9SS type A sorting domain-containing protein [candidate division Zixibacteria bacterium]|nr:T9SS type A sorting domain-containing protein [candidate division Zixibacteria bacterium]
MRRVLRMVFVGAAICMSWQMVNSQSFREDFNSDVFGSGSWSRSDASVYVNTTDGWLHIASDGWGDWDDCADKSGTFQLPLIVEWRARLVSGGQNYTVPAFALFWGSTNAEAIHMTYLPGSGYGWHFGTLFTDIHTMGPVAENQWVTVRAVIRAEGGELLAKFDGDSAFTPVVTRTWSIPDNIVTIRFRQNWDAVCDYDYIQVTSSDQQASGWCDGFETYQTSSDLALNWHGSGNTPGMSVDNSIAFSGSQSLKMFGVLGSCWGVVATRPMAMNLPVDINFAVRNGTEPLSGCHPYRAVFGLRTGGPDWWNCPCPQFVVFLPNGDIRIPQPSGTIDFSGYALDTWHTIKCDLSSPGDGQLHVKIWANDEFLGEFEWPYESWMTESAYLDISSQEGTVWFDDVCVKPGPPPVTTVALDIRPGSCPNPMNIKADPPRYEEPTVENSADIVVAKLAPGTPPPGVIPAAILGTANFDVATIDVSTIKLIGVSPVRTALEDVSRPVAEGAAECECTTEGPDGLVDLTMKYSYSAILTALGSVNVGDVKTLKISGKLTDGSDFEGLDCVVIVGNPGGSELASGSTESLALANYPNPFNPATTISFTLPQAGYARLDIFNNLGQRVATLVEERLSAGFHTFTWDASGQASGLYLYRLTTGDFSETKKMLLLK